MLSPPEASFLVSHPRLKCAKVQVAPLMPLSLSSRKVPKITFRLTEKQRASLQPSGGHSVTFGRSSIEAGKMRHWSEAYPSLSEEVLSIVSPALAIGTVAMRARVSRLLGRSGDAENAVKAIDSLGVSLGTKMQYAKAAQAIFPELAESLAIKLYKRALAKQGAAMPIRQAKPLEPYQVVMLAESLDRRTALVAMLAYKAAARWSEVCQLRREDFLAVSPSSITISWRNIPKASQIQPFRQDMFAVIEGSFTPLICEIVSEVPPGEQLSTTSTERMSLLMTQILGSGYTTHSLKRGAVTQAMEHVAAGAISLENVMRLSKHKSLEMLLRYAGKDERTALALGTQNVSRLL